MTAAQAPQMQRRALSVLAARTREFKARAVSNSGNQSCWYELSALPQRVCVGLSDGVFSRKHGMGLMPGDTKRRVCRPSIREPQTCHAVVCWAWVELGRSGRLSVLLLVQSMHVGIRSLCGTSPAGTSSQRLPVCVVASQWHAALLRMPCSSDAAWFSALGLILWAAVLLYL